MGAPTALRIPISRVRSVTVTSMMFITPIPPTSSEIAATAPSSVVNVLDVDCAVVSSVPSLMTENGRSATVVSACAARMSSTSVAALSSVAGGLPLDEQLAERRVAGELVLDGRVGGDHDAVLVGDAR